MRIELSKSLEGKDLLKRLNISSKDIVRVVTNPSVKQSIRWEDLEILLFIREERPPAHSYILVMGSRKNNTLHVNECLRILPSLIKEVGTLEPIILLQQLAFSFGVPVRICGFIRKFFFRESFPIPKDFKGEEGFTLIGLPGPYKSGTEIITSMFFKIRQDLSRLECAILFTIDLSSYLSWIKGEKKMRITAKNYDVFIAYKRDTAKDLASHLKSCLSKEGLRAFFDLTDIPKEYDGTKWFEVRDQAIANSRRFLLIMTIGIESSREVAKEFSLAKRVPNMKFIFMRHEDLEREITIRHAGEQFNLKDVNQVTFDTTEDLARKVLKILSEKNHQN